MGGSSRVRRDHRGGYKPSKPIRVHMVSDENLNRSSIAEDPVVAEKIAAVRIPPPAYGLWRSSVVRG
jgi:hypothetical protein